MVNLHNIENVSEHIIEDLKDTIRKIMEQISPIADEVNSNLMISAINHIAAMMVQIYISDDPVEIKKAARNMAVGFLKNVKFYTGVDPMEVEEPNG